MRSLVIGGTLFIGRVLVSKLVARGHDVTVLHRKPSHDLGAAVDSLQADRNDADAVRAVLRGRPFDFVFDNVFDWERGTTGEQVAATALACDSNALRRYVFMSSVAAYANNGTEIRDEDSPLASDTDPDLYKRLKADSERALFGLDLPVVTLRPPFVYGPGNPFYREAFFWDRIEARRPVIVPEDGSRLMQFIHVEDLAECAVLAAITPGAERQAFNVADPRAVSQAEFVRTLAAAAGADVSVVPVARQTLIDAAGHAMRAPYYFGQYLDLPPIPQNCGKAAKLLAFSPRSLAEGLAETYRWWKAGGRSNYPAADFRFDDGFTSV